MTDHQLTNEMREELRPKPPSLAEEALRMGIHFQLNTQPHPNGIACPECQCELMDSNPSICLTSCPPQYSVHCPSCGYTGTRY